MPFRSNELRKRESHNIIDVPQFLMTKLILDNQGKMLEHFTQSHKLPTSLILFCRVVWVVGGREMLKPIKIEIKPEEIIEAVKGMKKKERESFIEDLLASTSPEYLTSIKEARADYKARRVKTHEEVFGP